MGEAVFEMSDEDKAAIVAEFLGESDLHIQTLNACLLNAEELLKNNKEVSADEINRMFRAAHTIKGSASMLGFTTLSSLTHEMETILNRVRDKKLNLSLQIIDVLFGAFDTLNTLLDKLKSEGTDVADIAEAVDKIKAILNAADQPGGSVAASIPTPAPISVSAPVQDAAPIFEIDKEASKYMVPFIEDSQQCIDKFEQIVVNLQSGNFQPENVNELFRLAHTIKGSSGIVKLVNIEKVAHKMEDFLSPLREKGLKPDANALSMLQKGNDWLRAQMEALKKGTYQNSDITGFLNEFSSIGTAVVQPSLVGNAVTAIKYTIDQLNADEKNHLQGALSNKNNIYQVNISVQKVANIVLKATLTEERLKKTGMVLKATPKIESMQERSGVDVVVAFLYASPGTEEEVKKIISIDQVDLISVEKLSFAEIKPVVEEVKNPMTSNVAVAPKPSEADANKAKSIPLELTTMKVDSRKLDNLMNLAGELVITRARFAQLVSEFNSEILQIKEVGSKIQEWGGLLNEIKSSVRKISPADGGVNKGENFHEIVRTLENMETHFIEVSNGFSMKSVGGKVYSLDEATSSLGKLSSDIQSAVMQTRMVPIEGVFGRFKRLVRDIAKDLGKDVNLEVFGEETELDKKIIDSLPDSLTHMIRNSVDHGIESKEDRLKVGKSPMGKVTLRATHRGNSICIDIADDGKGLDPDKICNKAIEKGILTPERAAKMTDKEKLNLIFLPGFSTAEKVTGLSGRGVGMDVVKKMIESLNGTVDIESEIGKGSTFVLKIPLTLAIIQALLVVIGEEVYAFPLETVSEIIKVNGKDVYSIDGNATVKLRDHALSMVSLTKTLAINKSLSEDADDKKVVVITNGEQLVGVPVDRLIGEDEIVIKALPDYFSSVKGISGASILGDGRIALILDALTIIREA